MDTTMKLITQKKAKIKKEIEKEKLCGSISRMTNLLIQI